MTRKAPAGKRHASCIDHVEHPAGANGWLCVTTYTENASWPPFALYQPAPGVEGPYIPAPARHMVDVDRAADMVTFADSIAAARADHAAAERLRPIGSGRDETMYATNVQTGARTYRAHDSGAPRAHLPFVSHANYPEPRSIADLAAELTARKAAGGRKAPASTVRPYSAAEIEARAESESAASLAAAMRGFASDMLATGRELGILAPAAEPGPLVPSRDIIAAGIAPEPPATDPAIAAELDYLAAYHAARHDTVATSADLFMMRLARMDALADGRPDPYAPEPAPEPASEPAPEPYDSAAADLAYWRERPHTGRAADGTGRWISDRANGSTIAGLATCDTCAEPLAFHVDASECSTGGWSHDMDTLALALEAFEADATADAVPVEPAAAVPEPTIEDPGRLECDAYRGESYEARNADYGIARLGRLWRLFDRTSGAIVDAPFDRRADARARADERFAADHATDPAGPCTMFHYGPVGVAPRRCTLTDGHAGAHDYPAAEPVTAEPTRRRTIVDYDAEYAAARHAGRPDAPEIDARGILAPWQAPEPAATIAPAAEIRPEPAAIPPAVILAAVAAPAGAERPSCPRCGQTFRPHGNGRAWHIANRPDCATGARPAIAS